MDFKGNVFKGNKKTNTKSKLSVLVHGKALRCDFKPLLLLSLFGGILKMLLDVPQWSRHLQQLRQHTRIAPNTG